MPAPGPITPEDVRERTAATVALQGTNLARIARLVQQGVELNPDLLTRLALDSLADVLLTAAQFVEWRYRAEMGVAALLDTVEQELRRALLTQDLPHLQQGETK